MSCCVLRCDWPTFFRSLFLFCSSSLPSSQARTRLCNPTPAHHLDYLIKVAVQDTMFNLLKSAGLALLVVATRSLAADVSNACIKSGSSVLYGRTDGRTVPLPESGNLSLLIHVAGGRKQVYKCTCGSGIARWHVLCPAHVLLVLSWQ